MAGKANQVKRGGAVVAVVLGTALSAFSPARADADVNDLTRYCAACWRNARIDPNAWSDCTQEVFRRLLERVTPEAWGRVLKDEGDERREFFRAIDAVKKRTQRQHRLASGPMETVADGRLPQERARLEERELVDQAAAEILSPRQQQILRQSFEGWSVQDIAIEMKLPPERVSDEKYKAIRKLRAQLAS